MEGSAGSAFVVYSHIGVSSRSAGEGAASGGLALRDDLRSPAGLLAAPLIVMVLDSVASATLSIASAVPTRVDVEVFDEAADVSALRVDGRVRRSGRSQIFYDCRIVDADDPRRLVAYGSVTMAVTGPPVAQYAGHTRDGAGPQLDGRPLTEVFDGRAIEDGRYEIAPLTSRTGFGRLHAEAITVMAEAAATDLLRAKLGPPEVRTERLEAHLLGGRRGPFPVTAEVLAVDGDRATCRIEIIDNGADSRLVSLVVGRFRVVGPRG